MVLNKIERDVILAQIARPTRRSALFWWLLENHERVLNAANGQHLSWKELCKTFAGQGITDVKGNPPSETTARITWMRVRAEKKRLDARRATAVAAQAAAAAANPRRNMPSQFGKGQNGPPFALVAAGGPNSRLPAVADGSNNGSPPAVVDGPNNGPPSEGEEYWNEFYKKDVKGYVWATRDSEDRIYINIAGGARARQVMNASVGRKLDDGIEKLLGPRQEVKR